MEVRPDHHHPVDEIRTANGDEQADVPTVAPPDDVSRAADDLFEHPDRLGRHVVVVKRRVGVGGTAMTAAVEGDDAVTLGETVCQPFQRVAVRQAAVHDEDRGGTRPVLIDPRRMAVDLDSLTHASNLRTTPRAP